MNSIPQTTNKKNYVPYGTKNGKSHYIPSHGHTQLVGYVELFESIRLAQVPRLYGPARVPIFKALPKAQNITTFTSTILIAYEKEEYKSKQK